MTLKVRITTSHKGAYVIAFEGQIDAKASASLDRAFFELSGERPRRVLINMTGVEYISSSGIKFLFDLMRHVREQGGVASLFGLKPSVRKVLELVKAIPLEQIFLTMDDADAYLDHLIAEEDKNASAAENEGG